MRPQDFYIRAKANTGVRVDLDGPCGRWIQVRSVWSDAYSVAAERMKANAIAEVALLASAPSPEAARQMHKWQQRARRAKLVASLIADWSLTESCTESEKFALLIKNPRLRRQIEVVAENIHAGGIDG